MTVSDDTALSELQMNRDRIINLVDEAESLRRKLGTLLDMRSQQSFPELSTRDNTAIRSEAASVSPSSAGWDLYSPAASTIYLSSRSRKGRARGIENISPELQAVISRVSSSTHRKALLAIDQYGISGVKYKNGFTALHWASKAGLTDVVSYLISKGADILAKDSEGNTAMDYADKRADMETSLLLKRHSRPCLKDMVDMDTLREPCRKALEAIERHGWSSLKWGGGFTVLHWAYQNHRDDVIAYCRSIGAPFDIRDGDGKLPVNYAN